MQVAERELKRVIFSMPPRHGKSELCSVSYPPHYMSGGEERNLILASYASSLATIFGRKARNIVKSPVHKRIFHGVTLAKDLGSAGSYWALNNKNEFVAAGVGGGITGKGGDLLIDDPIKSREQANSAVYREKLKDWYRDDALTRLAPGGAVVIIMTRWHYDDLVGWLLREWPEENWTVFTFPAIQNRDPVWYDQRTPGEALWEARYSLKILEKIREESGPITFNGLYQQQPSRGTQAIFQLLWIKQDFNAPKDYDDLKRTGRKFARVVASWDTAFEKKKRNAYNVGTLWGEDNGDYYLLDLLRFRGVFPEVKKRIVAFHEKWKTDAVLIERKASGHDLLHELRHETDVPVIGIKPCGDKIQRADAVSGRFEAGRVHIPRIAPWLSDYLSEVDEFPDTAYLDQVDSTTQAISWMSKHGTQEAIAA